MAASHLSVSLCIDQRGGGCAAHHPAVDPGMDRQLPADVIPFAPQRRGQRVHSRHLQRPRPARYLDWLLGGAALPRTGIAWTTPCTLDGAAFAVSSFRFPVSKNHPHLNLKLETRNSKPSERVTHDRSP